MAGLSGSALRAATITVTSAADAAPAVDGAITLREAIASANLDAPVNADVPNVGFAPAGADTIEFADGMLPATIYLYDEFAIGDGGLTIQGPADRTRLILDAQETSQHFDKYTSLGDLAISGLTLTDGRGTYGGSIRFHAAVAGQDLELTNVAFAGNQATDHGGALFFQGYMSELTIRDCAFDDNAADDGGAAYVFSSQSEVLIEDSSMTDNEAAADGGALHVVLASMTIRHSTISGNHAVGNGGAIHSDVTLEDCTLESNEADGDGGAVAAVTLTADDSDFAHNRAAGDGGALFLERAFETRRSTFDDNSAGGQGGALFGSGSFNSPFTQQVERSTFSANAAQDGDGGALRLDIAEGEIVNSTLSGNTASHRGGALRVDRPRASDDGDGDLFAIRHSTIAGNTAGIAGGGVFQEDEMLLDHSIVADNRAAAVDEDLAGDEFYSSYSLVENLYDGAGVALHDLGGTVLNNDPDLGPLADHGGPTLTHLPNPASPALEAGDPTPAAPPATDQRGLARIVGTIDIGAVEVEAAQPAVPVVEVPALGPVGKAIFVALAATAALLRLFRRR